ncbi:hypothetical protein A3224_12945 [Microbulbifer thermotolerans]|uniref:Uncharacterized protein n=1 Tax=Microbulbifer thermotolerans TaxID=252514 RepID=A0A143HPE3_MICTH|nr:hypothetical protein A3224_12945 [Microbulbifer thermotolerans]
MSAQHSLAIMISKDLLPDLTSCELQDMRFSRQVEGTTGNTARWLYIERALRFLAEAIRVVVPASDSG